MNPLPAKAALDQFFIEARCRLLDLAAILDRIDRGADRSTLSDTRLATINQAITALSAQGATRAEAVQKLFSLDYDPLWPRPVPR